MRGGTDGHRIQIAALTSAHNCSTGKRANFYSQGGEWDVSHCLTGPARGHRDDCSSWFTSVYHSCGLDDPNGARYTGGFTGTLGAHGRAITRTSALEAIPAQRFYGGATRFTM